MSDKVMNRWLVVVGAILIQLCLGAIYAWSVFTPALTASTPSAIAAVYGASQLGLDDARFAEMTAACEADREALKAIEGKIKSATDPAEIDELGEEKAAIVARLDAVVGEYVPGETTTDLTYDFSNMQSQAIFSAGLAFFAIVMVLAGRLMPRVGPRKLAIAGGVVLGAGYAAAGLIATTNFWINLLLIGVIGGSGIGLAYVVPIAVGMRWFPDKKGLINGLAVAGFGFGALLWVKLAGAWGHLIAEIGLGSTWLIYGGVFFAAVVIGGLFMVFPPDGWQPEGWTPPTPSQGGAAGSGGTVDFASGQMLRTPQFYMIFLTFVFGAGAGLMSIGLMKAFPMKALTASGLDIDAASAAAGTAMAVFFSLANGLGRIIWGALSDKLGRKRSIFVMMATQGIVVIAFQWMAGSEYLLYLGATIIGFNFGGNFSLFPSITADTFGTKFVGQNYPWVFLAYGVGGIAGPLMGGKLGDTGNFPLAFSICGGAVLLAAVIIALVKPPREVRS